MLNRRSSCSQLMAICIQLITRSSCVRSSNKLASRDYVLVLYKIVFIEKRKNEQTKKITFKRGRVSKEKVLSFKTKHPLLYNRHRAIIFKNQTNNFVRKAIPLESTCTNRRCHVLFFFHVDHPPSIAQFFVSFTVKVF